MTEHDRCAVRCIDYAVLEAGLLPGVVPELVKSKPVTFDMPQSGCLSY